MDVSSSGRGQADAIDDDRALHARLLTGDPTAPSDLALAHLEPLIHWLASRFPSDDPQLLETVAANLILDLPERPQQYDPDRASLSAYLRMAAYRDVQNELAKERRRQRGQISLDVVELSALRGNSGVEGALDPAEIVLGGRRLSPEAAAIVRAQFDDVEWEVLELHLDGERRTSVFAPVLRLDHLPETDQRREVKKVKDRLLKRLRRLAPEVWIDE